MRFPSLPSLAFLPLLSLTACAQEGGQDPVTVPDREPGDGQTYLPSDFVRYVRVGDGGHLDTAITTYEKSGVQVVFYGAVHIADKACYEELNDRFATCDVLLYELVGPEDYRPTKEREQRGFNPIGLLQQGLKNGLELSFQLDEIDYLAKNFVHADMTPQEFQESMAERGESLLSIMWDMMLGGMEMQRDQAEEGSEPEPFDLVKAFRNGEGRHLMRTSFAQQLEQMEMLAAGGDGSTLLEGRNEKCLQVLKRELGNGHDRIGIYYGAAHLPHMEQRLVEGFGFKKVKHEWLVAWDCKKRPDPKVDRELIKLRRRCKKELRALAEVGLAWRRHHERADVAPPESVRELAAIEHEGAKVYEGPFEDPWGTEYRVEKRRFGNRWNARSAGPDKQFDTDDDVVVAEPRR